MDNVLAMQKLKAAQALIYEVEQAHRRIAVTVKADKPAGGNLEGWTQQNMSDAVYTPLFQARLAIGQAEDKILRQQGIRGN